MDSIEMASLLEVVASENRRIKKVELLKEFCEDEFFRAMLKWTYDPSISFWVKGKTLDYIGFTNGPAFDMDIISNALVPISEGKFRGNEGKKEIERMLNTLGKVSAALFTNIIDHDLKAGFNVAAIEAACPGLIKIHPYMRCSHFEDADIGNLDWMRGVYSQEKANGSFVDILVKGKVVEYRTRAGNLYPPEFFKGHTEVILEGFEDNFSYHGEVRVRDATQIFPRSVGNGMLNSILQGGDISTIPGFPIIELWDMVHIEEIAKGRGDTSYEQRFTRLAGNMFDGVYLRLIPTLRLNNKADAFKHFESVVNAGGEGTVIKDSRGVWLNGTSPYQIKVKPPYLNTFEVIGFSAGQGKFEGQIGAIHCASAEGKVLFSTSGMTDEVRQEMTDNQVSWIGKMVEIKHGGLSKSKDKVTYSLIEPRFIELRLDKTVADTFKEIART